MYIPVIFIIVGVYFLFRNYGWPPDFTLSWSFYWSIALVLIGLILLLKRRD